MVDYSIEHQPEVLSQAFYLVPSTKGWIDLGVVNDGEAIVRRIGKEGQYVNTRDHAAQSRGQYPVQGFQGGHAGFLELVTVGDQDGISFGELSRSCRPRQGWITLLKAMEECLQALPQ